MSETPLTDAAASPCAEPGYQEAGCVCVAADFSRKLERALAAKNAECERLREDAENYMWLRDKAGSVDWSKNSGFACISYCRLSAAQMDREIRAARKETP